MDSGAAEVEDEAAVRVVESKVREVEDWEAVVASVPAEELGCVVVMSALGVEGEVVGVTDVTVEVGDVTSVEDTTVVVVGVADVELVDPPVPRGTFCRLRAASIFEAVTTVATAKTAMNARVIPLK